MSRQVVPEANPPELSLGPAEEPPAEGAESIEQATVATRREVVRVEKRLVRLDGAGGRAERAAAPRRVPVPPQRTASR